VIRPWVSVMAGLLAVVAVPAQAQRARLLVSLTELEARAGQDSLDPVVHYDIALGYWVAGRFDDAERSLRRAVTIEPRFAPGYLGLAFLPYARRPKLWNEDVKGKVPPEWVARVEESDRSFRRAFLLDPMVDLKIYGLVFPPREAIVIGRNATETYAALVRGFESFWDGQYSTSYNWLQQVLQKLERGKEDDIPQALLWYHGLAAAHTYQYDVAVKDFQRLLARAVAKEQTDTLVRSFSLASNQIRYVLATISRRAGLGDEAVALYQESLEKDLGLFMGHVQMAEIYEERRQWDAAITERRRAVESNPENSSLQYDLGYTLARALRFREASEVLSEAMEANPHNARIPYTLGLVRLRLNDRSGARDAFHRFVAIAPSRFGSQVTEARERIAELEQ
jgi:tetratricopeptide (TPR) repeat protein